MNKATVNMINWEVYVYDERYTLSGIADNHPSLGKNTYVSRISSLVNYSFEDPRRRNNFYADISKIQEDYSDDILLNHIMELQIIGQNEIVEMKQREHERLMDIAGNYNDCVYIEVSNVGCGSLLAYHLGDEKGVVYPSLHSGMFQDSVLYRKDTGEDDSCSLDFRYFPKGLEDVMETYSWSDNIKIAVIKNDTGHHLRFNGIDIPIGETKIFDPDGQ